MSGQGFLLKYIRNSERVLAELKIRHIAEAPSQEQIAEVVEYAKRYLSDAEYYGEKQQYETGLVSVAYCEGLLDALRLLKLVDFTWPEIKEEKTGRGNEKSF
jgi:FAD synthetase